MNKPESKKRSRAAKGIAATAAITVAAGLAAAAIMYLRKRGISPKSEAKKLGGRAKTAASILKGESKAAYDEVRQTVIEELVMTKKPVTKQLVLATVKDVLTALKKHGTMTSEHLALLGKELQADWASMMTTAKKQQE